MLLEYLEKWKNGDIRVEMSGDGDDICAIVMHIPALNYNVDSDRFSYLMDHINARSGGSLSTRTTFQDFKNGLLILHVDCRSFYYDESKVTESIRIFLEVLLPSLEY